MTTMRIILYDRIMYNCIRTISPLRCNSSIRKVGWGHYFLMNCPSFISNLMQKLCFLAVRCSRQMDYNWGASLFNSAEFCTVAIEAAKQKQINILGLMYVRESLLLLTMRYCSLLDQHCVACLCLSTCIFFRVKIVSCGILLHCMVSFYWLWIASIASYTIIKTDYIVFFAMD